MAESNLPSPFGSGPGLIGAAVAGFILTRIINWLPLGFVGTAVNRFVLWPLIVIAAVIGGLLVWRRSNRSTTP